MGTANTGNGPEQGTRADGAPVELLDMVWPETGLQTGATVPRRARDTLSLQDDLVELQIDFVTLALSPLEFIQLAASLRMCVDGLLEQHPSLQRAVVNAFDIRD